MIPTVTVIRAAANFDQGYDPINLSSGGSAATASSYTVRDGDTLRTIAKTFWGDESLWFLIADANGLSLSGSHVSI